MQLIFSKNISYIYEELVQFSYLLNEKCSGVNVAERDIWMYQFLKKDWASVFPNIEIALRIYLSMMCSNCSCERSFWKLNLIKNHLRSVMKDDRLSALSIMNIEAKILNMIEFDDYEFDESNMIFMTKNWESDAQLNHLNDIMGISSNYLIAP